MKKTLYAATAALFAAAPALAEIKVMDAYARSSGPSAKAGAAFMMIENTSMSDDRLISATSDISARVELHTHIEKDGIMSMVEVEAGFVIPAGGSIMLMRGGNHVMFMGLKDPMVQGEMVPVTLTFEKAGDVVIEVPVDLERKPSHGHGHGHGHSSHNHGDQGS